MIIGFVFVLLCCHFTAAQDADKKNTTPATDVRYEGKTIAEWINVWQSNNFTTGQAAKRALIAIGEPAVGELVKVIQENRRESGMAIQTLAEMGPNAKPALPFMLEIAANPLGANPEGWTWNVSKRDLLLSEVRQMSWASDQWILVLERIAGNAAESETSRKRAVSSLSGMGTAAEPILRRFAASADRETRSGAVGSLAALFEATGRDKTAVYEEAINKNPLDPNVPEFLVRRQGRYNAGVPQPLTQRVKMDLRQRLAEKPDAELAFTLATIIRNGLSNTDLEFAAPTDSFSSQSPREDTADNYDMLAEALTIGFENAAKDSDLFGRCGRSLARLRLLQGDWDGMNAALVKLGQEPIPAEWRPKLPAPPLDWTNLRRDWQPADVSMTSGKAAIELTFEKDGKPLAGAHVLIKRRPPDQGGGRLNLGIRADTLLLSTQPLEVQPYDAFGYRANDRALTRYAVSDATGKIRIENLPAMPVVVEALIPTSNFTEPGRNWDLLMETAPGELRPTGMEGPGLRGGARGRAAREPIDDRPRLEPVSRREGPAVVELKEGETLVYPKFVVRRQLVLSVAEWSSVDVDDFVLWWGAVSGEEAFDHYEVEMMLTAPSQHPDLISQQRVIRSTSEQAIDTRWPVGQKGVGGQRLRPGNIYMFEVRAIDRDGKVLARLPRTRVWTPWPNRKSQPPQHESQGARDGLPFYDQMWWRTGVQVAGNPRVDNRERIAEYLPKSGDQFEFEYVQLGRAWLQCLDDNVVEGRREIERLANDLPEGNIVRGTARELLKKLAAGQELPRRLEFVADE
jgi:hypothetical protein